MSIANHASDSGGQNHDIIVIGGSAGAVEATASVVRGLPRDLPAAVFVAIHLAPDSPSQLAEILGRKAVLPAVPAVDGEPIVHGRIYVATPDRHLLLGKGVVRVSRGPRENSTRPAIDPLFRSAAAAYGPRVIGVVLSGNLDDGSAGLLEIRKRGGITVIQDPVDARHPSMPSNAQSAVGTPDYVSATDSMGLLLGKLALTAAAGAGPAREGVAEREIALAGLLGVAEEHVEGTPSVYGCPDCGGVLWELDEANVTRFRCRVGHSYSQESLVAAQSEGVEAALWTALRALSESAAQARTLSRRMLGRGLNASAERFRLQALEADSRVEIIRSALLERGPGIGPGATGEADAPRDIERDDRAS